MSQITTSLPASAGGAGLRSPHHFLILYLQTHTWGSCRSEPRSRARQRCRKRWISLFSKLVVRSREVRPITASLGEGEHYHWQLSPGPEGSQQGQVHPAVLREEGRG